MELFGIFLSVPVALGCSALYCLLAEKLIKKFIRLSYLLRILSVIVLGLFVIEIVLLVSLGATRSQRILGPGFYIAHLTIFFLGPPALANMLILRKGAGLKWYATGFLCTLFAFCLVLIQYSVSESLFGIE
jgi:hypothetical protein